MGGRLKNWKQGREDLHGSAEREGHVWDGGVGMETEALWRKAKGENTVWLRSSSAGRVELSNWNFCEVCCVLCDVNLHYVSPVETSEQNQFLTLCAGFSLGEKRRMLILASGLVRGR